MICGIAICDTCKQRKSYEKCLICGCDLCPDCKKDVYKHVHIRPLCKDCAKKVEQFLITANSGLKYDALLEKTATDFIITAKAKGEI